jgi:hypothetical protein
MAAVEFARWLAETPLGASEVPIVVDYEGVVAATGSFLRGFHIPLCDAANRLAQGRINDIEDSTIRDLLRNSTEFFVVAANLEAVVAEEFDIAFSGGDYPCIEATLLGALGVVRGRIRGNLDQVLRQSLCVLAERGPSTASELHGFTKEPITVNAWNNRLSDLQLRRLIRRYRDGREWRYESIVSSWEDTNG